MGHDHATCTRQRRRWWLAGGAGVVLVLSAVRAPGVPTAARRLAQTSPTGVLTLSGHGFGHGRGMGQYGALGYALDQGWNYHQILDHFYGGTVSGQVAPGTLMTVDMTAHDGQDTIAVQERGELATSPAVDLACVAGAQCALRVSRTGPGTFRIYRGTACWGGQGGWVLAADGVSTSAVRVLTTAGITDNRVDMLQLCEANDTRWLRGTLVAQDTGTAQATVNEVPLDGYVRGVVPRESPAFWGTLGGGAGEQALEAQAVAARSYALAENRWPYARTCDSSSCQVYGGRAVQTSDGVFSDLEGSPLYAPSDLAVAATAGEDRVFTPGGGGPAGAPARTEYSSSTGGYSAGGTFPPVPDAGDATASNPNHSWTTEVGVSSVEAAYGQGALEAVDVTARNGLGDFGGRAVTVALTFSGGTVTTSGDEFAATFGLRSNWFTLSTAPAAPYLALTTDGSIYGFSGAAPLGSPAGQGVRSAAVGLATGPGGYWVLTAYGSVYAYGAVTDYGSVAGMVLNGPPHQIVATNTGKGYWIIASDGGVFSFGDAQFFGSTGGMRLNAPIVGAASTTDGRGYWLLGADGGVFSFGDAQFFGSTGGIRLNAPVNAMSVVPASTGYWLAAADGGVFSFGSAPFEGSLTGRPFVGLADGIEATSSGNGYLMITTGGQVFGLGDAVAAGGPADLGATAPAVGLAYAR